MIEEIKNIKSEKSDLRKFGITVGLILMIVSGFLFWKEKESFQILITSGAILLILGVTIPVILKYIYWVWMIFATIIGWIMTRVILSLMFYAIITPIGFILRLFGKQFIELSWNKTESTYWKYRSNCIFEKENYEKQF